jgi:NADPH:quinone reductase-like Zn-dependent oxidoreductase
VQALVYDRYGRLDVLAFRDMPVPETKRNEILVRVRAAALNPKDSFVRKGRFRAVSGRAFPKRVGVDFAGEVVAVGAGVPEASRLEPGARVFGMLQEWTYRRGTVAEYVAATPQELGPMPPSLSFEEAAALPLVSLTALQALRDVAGLRAGDTLCIHGASGGVGTAAIQIGVALGASVTSTSSAANLALCRSLGAREALDYAAVDPFAAQRGRPYRVILDAFGNLSLDRVKHALAADGVYVTTVPSARIVADTFRTLVGRRRARLVIVRPRRADLATLAADVEAGRLRPVVDRVVPFEEAIDGMRHLETKRARGKIVVSGAGREPSARALKGE